MASSWLLKPVDYDDNTLILLSKLAVIIYIYYFINYAINKGIIIKTGCHLLYC